MNHHPGGDVGNNNIIYPLHQNDRKVRCVKYVWDVSGHASTHKGSGFKVLFGDLSLMDNAKDKSSTLHSSWTYILVRNGEDDFCDGKTDYFCIRMVYLAFMRQPVCMDTGQYDLCYQD